ncbi:type II secretion system protein (plasmid) [Xylanimonas cellulosilytica DSM 15894]|uniref:Type II secretion system protein n=1 Tax=Xylanimonas cellulosilytica (strain DSM 15894 / JCM 12276 / CECT 5975 / KCTC 9989 / LMG 20990 / NBRC 107835 / XIL07) TaxID=446471 RepID=D1C0V3_XYLCX|nr:type II secretion system F family protein [Xylanimonas cellulosilytica]ACZ32419.1 type II secretion system protein [Xylanimonas cellulosilytica DSM 15894]
MPILIPALGGALVVLGLIGVVLGARRSPAPVASAPTKSRTSLSSRWNAVSKRTKILALVGLVAGVVIYLIAGWVIAIVVGPIAAAGLPALLSAPGSAERIDKLEALEEWTRGLAGVLTVGVGLEEALRATLRSTPDAIRPEVTTLVARLRARMSTEDALRAFADDLDDATGDLVASFLISGARRRGQGLASVLNSLAESVAADVRARRAIEADRAKPRATARWVTIITLGVLGVLFIFSSEYLAPYRTPAGQLLLALFLAIYVSLLIWMRAMAKGEKLPRFLGTNLRQGAR